ncbi:MAG TPA: hypothetical protein DCR14_12305 [Acidimicrobiaceae bacterium]|nr:hypothetical protein [Acidimicrobiaceae bacterium]
MSIAVELSDLPDTLAPYPWGYLVTVGPDLRAHVLAVPTRFLGGTFLFEAGRSTRANAAARPEVTLVFPPIEPHGYSLLVDGSAVVHDAHIEVRPSTAVLHRPAITASE